jgi:hypothetical protein
MVNTYERKKMDRIERNILKDLTYHMTSLINFMTISFKIRKKCNMGSPRLPIVPIVIPNATQNVIKPIELIKFFEEKSKFSYPKNLYQQHNV